MNGPGEPLSAPVLRLGRAALRPDGGVKFSEFSKIIHHEYVIVS
jgi:hypothetical protein